MDDRLRAFIKNMPKVELHLHIEGSLEPELAFQLARRNGVTLEKEDGTPYADANALKADYQFGNLQEFLGVYYKGMGVLKTEHDFYDLTMAYLRKIKKQNVTHTEIFFDPQQHIQNGVAFDVVVNGITHALKDAESKLGISSKLIMSFLRHLPASDALSLLDVADPYLKDGTIAGIGLDSSEKGYPPQLFEEVFGEAKKRYPHLKLVAHAGEEGPHEYVTAAIDQLHIDRIDHGNHSLDDPNLVTRLTVGDKKGIGLTVCPLSNLRLRHTVNFETGEILESLKDHPLKRMMDLGLRVTVNSDDPAYFRADNGEGGYMIENLLAITEALKLTRDDIITLAKNAIDVSFLSPQEKQKKIEALDIYVKREDAMARVGGPKKPLSDEVQI